MPWHVRPSGPMPDVGQSVSSRPRFRDVSQDVLRNLELWWTSMMTSSGHDPAMSEQMSEELLGEVSIRRCSTHARRPWYSRLEEKYDVDVFAAEIETSLDALVLRP